jgi:hypothetical protein
MVRALALLYESTGGNAWRNNDKWLSGEPCVDGWFGVHCCPQALPVLRGDDECTADGGGATGVLTTQGSAACHSGSVTGTALDLATCVVVKVLLPSNNLIGPLDGALCELPFLQHLDLSGNVLTGSLPSAADCLPRLTYLDLTQTRSWDDEGGVAGPVPEWLLDRLDFMAPLRLANNALDDPTAAESAVAISRLWQRCQTLGAEQCSGVPPIGCSAFNRQGQRYEVELDGLGCVRCPTSLEIAGLAGAVAGIVLLLVLLVGMYTRFMHKYPEHAKTHVASIMILVGHLQMLSIIGSLQLGWPLIIQKILASINLPLMSYIKVPCILTDPVLKALLSYVETAVVLLPLVGAWLVARCRREAWAEYVLSVLFSLLFTVGLQASVTLFMRYDEDQTRLIVGRLVAGDLWLFWLFLLFRFRRLLGEARVTAENAAAAKAKVAAALEAAAKDATQAAAPKPTGRFRMGDYVMVNGRRGKIAPDNRTSNPYKVTFDNGEVSGWLCPHDVTRDVTRAADAALQPKRSAEHDEERNESARDQAKSMPACATLNGPAKSVDMSLYQRLLAPKPKPPARKPVALLFEKAPPASANAYDLQKEARRAAEAVRYLTERYRSDDGLNGARWPLRSQWQLVVWARQGLLFLVSFFMDCVLWFSPYEAHQTARYFFATLAIAVLGGFWHLQAWRQPYATRLQHWLEAFLYAVDILAIILACVYGALTQDGAVQDGSMRLAFELGLGALLGASVLGAALVVYVAWRRERRLMLNPEVGAPGPSIE